MEIIKNNGFFWNKMTIDCKNFIKNYIICTQINKSYFVEHEFKYLQTNKPNEIIHMDLTDIPKGILLNLKDNKFYKIACIVDNLSKFAYAELISSKQSKEVLPVLMRYVNI